MFSSGTLSRICWTMYVAIRNTFSKCTSCKVVYNLVEKDFFVSSNFCAIKSLSRVTCVERFLYSSPETDNAVEVSLLCCRRSRISVEFPILCCRTSYPLHSEQSFETDNAVEVSILWAAKVYIWCFRGIWLFCKDGEVGHRRLGDNLPRLGVRPQRSLHLCSVSPNSFNCSNVVILWLIQVRSHYVHLVRDCHHPSSRNHHRICQGDPLHPSIHHPLSTIHVTFWGNLEPWKQI